MNGSRRGRRQAYRKAAKNGPESRADPACIEAHHQAKARMGSTRSGRVDPFHDRESRIVLLTGSAGGGKSALALAKAHQVCLSYPGVFCLVIRKTRESMTSGSALFLESEIINDQGNRTRSTNHRSSIRTEAGSSTAAWPRQGKRIG